jgi:hypothetical protein
MRIQSLPDEAALSKPSGTNIQKTPPSQNLNPTVTARLSESARLERLILQLESIAVALESPSVAVVPYQHYRLGSEVSKRSSKPFIIGGTLIASWLGVTALSVAYFRHSADVMPAMQHAAHSASHGVSAPVESAERAPVQSGKALTNTAGFSSAHLNRAQTAPKLIAKEPAQFVTPKRQPTPFVAQAQIAAPQTVVLPLPDPDPPISQPVGSANWHQIINMKPCATAVAHHTAEGELDYWLVPRNGEKFSMAKVLSVGTNAEGVMVHNIDDGKDYTLTAAGEWKNGTPHPQP